MRIGSRLSLGDAEPANEFLSLGSVLLEELSQDSVRELIGCGKGSVVGVERWFRQVSFKTATEFANDGAVQRVG